MQTSPPVPHQVYYKTESQYGWAGALDYNPVSVELVKKIFKRTGEVKIVPRWFEVLQILLE